MPETTAPEHGTACQHIDTPVGPLVLIASQQGLCGLYFGHRIDRRGLPPASRRHPVLSAASDQLEEYFAGGRRRFDCPLDVAGTAFQRAVWGQLSAIPFGETRSYRQIAEAIGKPSAVRAVGLANGANPVSIIVPCHRVIGADGSLTGFGGGLDLKRQLLEHEGFLLPVA